jgi:hypothetical protein
VRFKGGNPMEDIGLKLKEILAEERQRFYDIGVKQQKLEEIRDLFQQKQKIDDRIAVLKQELNDIEDMEQFDIN